MLFPDNLIVAKSLLLQLRLRAAHEAFLETPAHKTDKTKCAAIIENYIDAYLIWEKEHNWHGLWGYDPNRWPLGRLPEDPRFDSALKYMHELFKGENLDAILDKIRDKLSVKHSKIAIADSCITPIKTFIARGRREEK